MDKYLMNNSKYHHTTIKRYIERNNILDTKQCSVCGIREWQGKPIVMQIHHINGDHNDNQLKNLQIICPNCHSQTDNYAGRNRKLKKLLEIRP